MTVNGRSILFDVLPFLLIHGGTGRASPKRLSRPMLSLWNSLRELMTVARFLEQTYAVRVVVTGVFSVLPGRCHIHVAMDAQCTWLLTELDPDGGLAFGLCDLGLGEPELGYVSLAELISLRGKLGLPVERDRHFEADRPISVYADEARARGRIAA
jgi:hypothetical protein